MVPLSYETRCIAASSHAESWPDLPSERIFVKRNTEPDLLQQLR